MERRKAQGIATVMAVLVTLLMSVLGMALILNSSSEIAIAANFRNAQEGLYAADAALERAIDDLSTAADWTGILGGTTRSAFVDGAPSGVRGLPDGSSLDLERLPSMVNCGKATGCSSADLTAHTTSRPWGANNPIWVLYAYGRLDSMVPSGTINSSYYVVVLLADDPSENDNDPRRDGNSAANPGTGIVVLRGEAFGPSGAHKVVEVTVARSGAASLRVLSWREIR